MLDSNQLQLLSLTLNRPSLFPGSPPLSQSSSTGSTSPPPGTPLPPGYHLVYFTPAFLEGELGADGTDVSYNPDAPFTRRMWAGGELSWSRGADGKPNLLRVGQEVRETTRVLSAEPKVVKRTGEEMLVVGVEKEFANDDGVALVDRRQGLLHHLNWHHRLTVLKKLGIPQSSTYISFSSKANGIIETPYSPKTVYSQPCRAGQVSQADPSTVCCDSIPFLGSHIQPPQDTLFRALGS